MSLPIMLRISKSTWDTKSGDFSSNTYYRVDSDNLWIYKGNKDHIIVAPVLHGEARTDSDLWMSDNPTAVLVESEADVIALLADLSEAPRDANGVQVSSLGASSSAGLPLMEFAIRSGNKSQQISQNFCDEHTWYSSSERHTNVEMVDSGDGYTWNLPANTIGSHGIVDVTHGRILHERRVRSTYQPIVTVDGVQKTEISPHDGSGDYSINVDTGSILFTQNQSGKEVLFSFSEVKSSQWFLTPSAGKKLRLVSAELQFSTDCQMEDSFVFQMYARVDLFPPLFPYWDQNPLGAPGPYPAGTKIPIGDAVVYQTVFDLICESNLAYATIPRWGGNSTTWRDLKSDVIIFDWNYESQASIDLYSGYGMEIAISLEHDIECSGSYAVVTFYCVSEDE